MDNIISDNEEAFIKDNTKMGRFILSLGKKNSGKSYLMMSYLKYALYHKIYGAIHFVCPVFDGEQNGTYNFLHNQKEVLVYKHYSEAVSKAVDKSRQTKRTLFLIDDGTSELMQNNDKTFILLISTTRHYAGLTLWANVHSCKKILSPVCRQNIDFLFLYHTPNIKLLNDIYDEYLSLLFDNFKEFKGFYLETLKEEHSCILYSTHFTGLDINVKHWNINENQIENLTATKGPAKPKPKESIRNPLRVEFNRRNKF